MNKKKMLVAAVCCTVLFGFYGERTEAAYQLNPAVKAPTMALTPASEIGVLRYENPAMQSAADKDAIVVMTFGTTFRETREKTIDVMASDYVRFARSRGESGLALLARHGLRNLVVPALTIELSSVSEVFGGSVLVEQVFSYPGLGQAAVTAGLGGDAPLLVAIALVSALVVFAGNALADVLYGVIDPRVRGREARSRG